MAADSPFQLKALEVLTIDQQTDRRVRSTYDSSVIIGVVEYKRGPVEGAAMMFATGLLMQTDEGYDSLRRRWLEARGDLEVVPIERPQKVVKPS